MANISTEQALRQLLDALEVCVPTLIMHDRRNSRPEDQGPFLEDAVKSAHEALLAGKEDRRAELQVALDNIFRVCGDVDTDVENVSKINYARFQEILDEANAIQEIIDDFD